MYRYLLVDCTFNRSRQYIRKLFDILHADVASWQKLFSLALKLFESEIAFSSEASRPRCCSVKEEKCYKRFLLKTYRMCRVYNFTSFAVLFWKLKTKWAAFTNINRLVCTEFVKRKCPVTRSQSVRVFGITWFRSPGSGV